MTDRIQPGDCADDNPTMIAGTVRALQREVRDGFEQFGRAILPALERLDRKMDVLIDRQNVIERRQDATDKRLDAIEREHASIRADVAALSVARPVGAPAPGTVTRRRRAAARK
jgi:hypothetical protein